MSIKCSRKRIILGSFVTSVAVTTGALITWGLLTYFLKAQGPTILPAKKFFGRIRVLEIGGNAITGNPENTNLQNKEALDYASEIEKSFQFCLRNLQLDHADVNVTRLEEHELTRLLGVEEKGIYAHISMTLHSAKVHSIDEDDISLALTCHSEITVEPESLSLDMKPLARGRMFRNSDDLLITLGAGFPLNSFQLEDAEPPQYDDPLITCPAIEEVEHGSILPLGCMFEDSIDVGLTCIVGCDTNHTVSGKHSMTCLTSGIWSAATPTCEVFCKPLMAPMNGVMSPSKCYNSTFNRVGDRCLFSCDPEYMLDGDSMVCGPNGLWQGTIPVCKRTCPVLSIPKNGELWPEDCATKRSPASKLCNFKCVSGYALAGRSSLMCDIDGRWNGNTPSCRRGCPVLQAPSNGGLFPPECTAQEGEPGDVMEGLVCVHTCNDGFFMRGSVQRMCGTGGMWTGNQVTCDQSCPNLILPPHMMARPQLCVSGRVLERQVCALSCEDTYTFFGTQSSKTCLQDGTWTESDGVCLITCPKLPPLQNGDMSPLECRDKRVADATECRMVCKVGFFVNGQDTVKCQGNGFWSDHPGKCLKKCPPVKMISYGEVIPANCTSAPLFQGTECGFKCDVGHGLVGSDRITCLADGTWTNLEPECKEETHFMIRQTTSEHDICLEGNTLTYGVEKADFPYCNMEDILQRWSVSADGFIKNIGLSKCITIRDPQPREGSYLYLEECEEDAPHMRWNFFAEDDSNPVFNLKDTEFYPSYGSASIAQIPLTSGLDYDSTWYGVTANGNFSIYDIASDGSCPKLRGDPTVLVTPGMCTTTSKLPHNTVCNFACVPGFIMEGTTTRTCTNGHWDNYYPSCRRGCPSLFHPQNGQVTASCAASPQEQMMRCNYQCDSNYLLLGEPDTTCLSSGTWSTPMPLCAEKCDPLSDVLNGRMRNPTCTTEMSLSGTICELTCQFPYFIVGDATRMCQSDGSWTGSWACSQGCNVPQPLVNGATVCDNNPVLVGGKCTHTCDGGFVLSVVSGGVETLHPGSFEQTCQADGLYTGGLPLCKKSCPALDPITNGFFTPANCTSSVQTEATVCVAECNLGYRLHVERVTTCQSSGDWTSRTFTCREEKQFLIQNTVISDPICAYVDASQPSFKSGVFVEKEFNNVTQCTVTDRSSLWTWRDAYSLLHVASGFCLTIQDIKSDSFTNVLLRKCINEDPSQKWECDGSLLRVVGTELYLTYGHTTTVYLAAQAITTPASPQASWEAKDALNLLNIQTICKLNQQECPKIILPSRSSVQPAICGNADQIDGTVCTLKCDSSYLLRTLKTNDVAMTCQSHGVWQIGAGIITSMSDLHCYKTCSALSAPVRTTMTGSIECTTGNAMYGDACAFECNPGFVIDGHAHLFCQKDGDWSAPLPSCKATCTHPDLSLPHPDSPHTEYPMVFVCGAYQDAVSQVLEGLTCTYICIQGTLIIEGSSERTCLSDGNWDNPLPLCKFKTVALGVYNPNLCPPPPALGELQADLCEWFVAYKPENNRKCAKFSCEPGYELFGDEIIFCSAITYEWSYPPQCRRKCEYIHDDCVRAYENSGCHIDCPISHRPSHGIGLIRCGTDAKWDDDPPICVYTTDILFNTWYTDGGGTILDLCMFGTDVYDAHKLLTVEPCQSGTIHRFGWHEQNNIMHTATGMCVAAAHDKHGARIYLETCSGLDPLQQWECSEDLDLQLQIVLKSDHTMIIGDGHAAAPGYTQPTSNLYLLDMTIIPNFDIHNGVSWGKYPGRGITTVCAKRPTQKNCPPLKGKKPIGGKFIPAQCMEEWAAEGQFCYLSCDPGYQPRAGSHFNAECLENGHWDFLNFECTKMCTPLVVHPNAQIIGCDPNAMAEPGQVCYLSCVNGFKPLSETQSICQWDGFWSVTDLKCAKFCPPVPLIDNGMVNPHSCAETDSLHSPGTSCTYVCIQGHNLNMEEPSRTCLIDGSWSGTNPLCLRVCAPIPQPTNGYLFPIGCSNTYTMSGGSCSISCGDGFGVVGNTTMECQEDGSWSNEVTDISSMCSTQCPPIKPPENGHVHCSHETEIIEEGAQSFPEDTYCRITCKQGFSLSGNWIRRCQETDGWTGSNGVCIEEEQFLICISKQLADEYGSYDKQVCLTTTEDEIIVKSDIHLIDLVDSNARWSWVGKYLIKDATMGKCLGIEINSPGQPLELKKCNETDPLQQWTCGDLSKGSVWLIKLNTLPLYPAYGYSSVDQVWVYDLNLYNPEKEDIYWFAIYVTSTTTSFTDEDYVTLCSSRNEGDKCPPLPTVESTQVNPEQCVGSLEENIWTGMMCSIECDVGFSLEGDAGTITCQTNGVWTASVPKCVKFCNAFDAFPHAMANPNECFNEEGALSGQIIAGETCSFMCDDGYMLVGDYFVTCLENGSWSGASPECKKICSNLSPIENGVLMPPGCGSEEQVAGTVCTFICNEGFLLTKPPCEKLTETDDCDVENPLLVVNATEQICGTAGDLITAAFALSRSVRSCKDDGTWSGTQPMCTDMCPQLEAPDNGKITPISCTTGPSAKGTICTYECSEKYTAVGLTQRICHQSRWAVAASMTPEEQSTNLLLNDDSDNEVILDVPPTCERYCEKIPPLGNNTIILPTNCLEEKAHVGLICHVECESDYVLIGEPETECQEDNTWSMELGSCIKKCPALDVLPNGEILPLACTMASLGAGALCTYMCLDKYALVGSVSTTCSTSGEWSHDPPVCKRRCRPLTDLYNGAAEPELSCFGDHIMVGEQCTFSCNTNYMLMGEATTECREDGEWSHPKPTCQKLCENPYLTNGKYTCFKMIDRELKMFSSEEEKFVWGTKCAVKCDKSYVPSSDSYVTCSSNGMWQPAFPSCLKAGIPMYIMQNEDIDKEWCLSDSNERRVLKDSMDNCRKDTAEASHFHWRWLGYNNLQNLATGRCIAVNEVATDEPLITKLCDTMNPLQWWGCSNADPFRMILRSTKFAPSTYQDDMYVVIHTFNDMSTFYTTYDFVTEVPSSVCSRKPGGGCPPLDNIPGATIEPPLCTDPEKNVGTGVKCSYVCDESQNMFVQGDAMTMCMGNGLWMYPPPTCIKSCPILSEQPTEPANSFYEDPDCVFELGELGAECTASCLDGFELIGENKRLCQDSGDWTEPGFECKRTCPVIFGVLDGLVSPIPCRSNNCTVVCSPGYQLAGSSVMTCNEQGEWDVDTPECKRDPQFQIISRFDDTLCVSVDSFEGSKATKAKCDEADGKQLFRWKLGTFLLIQPASELCLQAQDAKWTEITLEICDETNDLQLWRCGPEAKVEEYGLRVYDPYTNANLYMDLGVLETSNIDLEFLAKVGNWLKIETGYYKTSEWFARHYFAEGTVCSMRSSSQCPKYMQPYLSEGDMDPPICLNHDYVTEGLTCIHSCSEGTYPGAVDRTTCNSDGKWSEPHPECIGMYQCPALVVEQDTMMVDPVSCIEGSVGEGTKCYFSCKDGFHKTGDDFVICGVGGVWTSYATQCVQLCGAIPAVEGGTITPDWCLGLNSDPDSTCTVTCAEGFHLQGDASRKCKTTGFWSGDEAVCSKFCHAIPDIAHGYIFPSRCTTNENYQGNACEFRCEDGYQLIGAEKLTCDGIEWDLVPPKCVTEFLCQDLSIQDQCGTDVSVKYTDLLEGKVVANGTKVTVTCGTSCQLGDGMVTRTCLASGQWEGGDAKCKKICPPVIPNKNTLYSPTSCITKSQNIGFICTIDCSEDGYRFIGTRTMTCGEGGTWKEDPPLCEKIIDPGGHEYSHAFAIRQYIPSSSINICLTAKAANAYQIAGKECKNFLSSQLWRWRNFKRIESVQSGLCWEPKMIDGLKIIALATCDNLNPTQVFTCADLSDTSEGSYLKNEEQYLASHPDNIPVLVEFQSTRLKWEAIRNTTTPDELDLMYEPTYTMDKKNAICRQFCGLKDTFSSGTITSPGFPEKYPNNLMCDWEVNVPNMQIWIEGPEIGTVAPDGSCNNDKMIIYKMPSDEILTEICGSHPDGVGPFIGGPDGVRIEFVSDMTDPHAGFSVSWVKEEPLVYPNKVHCAPIFTRQFTTSLPVSCIERQREVGSKCFMKCTIESYIMNGATALTCLESGQWSAPPGYCTLFPEEPDEVISTVDHSSEFMMVDGSSCPVASGNTIGTSSICDSSTSDRLLLWKWVNTLLLMSVPDKSCWTVDDAVDPPVIVLAECDPGNPKQIFTCVDGYNVLHGEKYVNLRPKDGLVVETDKKSDYLAKLWKMSDNPSFSNTAISSLCKYRCAKMYYVMSAILRHPGYPDPIVEGIECSWTITSPSSRIVLWFDDFNLEDFALKTTCGDNNVKMNINYEKTYCGKSDTRIGPFTYENKPVFVGFTGKAGFSYGSFTMKWDTLSPIDHIIPDPVGKSFVIQQKEEEDICLVQSGEDVLQSPNSACAPRDPEHLWAWRDAQRIMSIGAEQCWTPLYSDTISIKLKTCDINDYTQVFSCGNLQASNTSLMLRSHNLFVRNVGADRPLLTPLEDKGMTWKAVADDGATNSMCRYTCGQLYETDSGVIFNPGYPDAYITNFLCEWEIKSPSTTVFLLVDFAILGTSVLKTCDEAAHDVIIIAKGNGDVYQTICGKNDPYLGPFSLPSHIKITFKSHSGSQGEKFAIRWDDKEQILPETITDQSSFRSTSDTFMIRQYIADKMDSCWKADHLFGTFADIKMEDAITCTDFSDFYLFQWVSYKWLQSVHKDLCLQLNENNKVAFRKCDFTSTKQHFRCGDPSKGENPLNLFAPNGKKVTTKSVSEVGTYGTDMDNYESVQLSDIVDSNEVKRKFLEKDEMISSNSICAQLCSSKYRDSSSHNLIVSPGYPGEYGPWMDCTWYVAGGDKTAVLYLHDVYLEEGIGGTCQSDSLEIFVYSDERSEYVLKDTHCGTLESETSSVYVSVSGKMKLHFKSNGEKQYVGFRADYLFKPHGTSIFETEVLSKPFMIMQKYPQENILGCLKGNKKIDDLGYVSFTTGTICRTMQDDFLWRWRNYRQIQSIKHKLCLTPAYVDSVVFLTLQPCDDENTGQMLKCGDISLLQYCLNVLSENMLLWNSGKWEGNPTFTSATLEAHAEWQGIAQDATNAELDYLFDETKNMSSKYSLCRQICGGIYTTPTGTFSSPNYPYEYMTNTECRWTITAPGQVLIMFFHDFIIESASPMSSKCNGDYLEILDGPTFDRANFIARLCGMSKTTIGPVRSIHGHLLVRFYSNNNIVMKGFSATWQTEAYDSPSDCGVEALYDEPMARLIGGRPTTRKESPWHATIISSKTKEVLCGATFVTEGYLVTAAHCFKTDATGEINYFDYIVIYGPSELWTINRQIDVINQGAPYISLNDTTFLWRMESVTLHPGFKEEAMDNDIAIVKVVDTLVTPYIVPGCMPPGVGENTFGASGQLSIPKMYCEIVGWDSETDVERRLQKAKIPLMSDQECVEKTSSMFGRDVNITTTLCAGYFDGSIVSLCDGDDGSGLMCEYKGNYYLLGVASYQLTQCETLDVPHYFTRVHNYKDWIDSIIYL